MNTSHTATLEAQTAGLAAIRLSGADAETFLQGQLTQDITRVTPDSPQLAGWNNAKGRLLCIVTALSWQKDIWLILPSALRDSVQKRLGMFVLRAAVKIDAPDVSINLNNEPDNSDISYCFEKNNSLYFCVSAGAHMVLTHGAGDNAIETNKATEADWRRTNITNGIPTIWPTSSESFVPQMVNLDMLDAISFSKGCYVGQEIVARTQNLGRIKRRMYGFSAAPTLQVHPGDKLFLNGREAGEIVDAVTNSDETNLLAVTRIEQSQEAFYLDADCTTLPVKQRTLPYAVPTTLD
jgi:folate-binding protein YgfZ